MAIEEKLKHLEEISMVDFSKKLLASPTTLQYSQERRAIMGDAPETTKMVDISIGNDNVTFYYLTEATEKYEDGHVYKDVDPNNHFQMERDPSATYEITLKFMNLRELTKTNPSPRINDVKNWLWSTDFQIWDNDPSFHWQGFNFKLSQLGMSIHPTSIPDKRWRNTHGEALIPKHLFDLFLHIKFFINLMAGQLLNRLRTSGYATKPMRLKPKAQTSAPVQPTNVEPPETEFDAKVQDNLDQLEPDTEVDVFDQENNAPVQQTQVNPEPPEDDISGVDAEITKPQERTRSRHQGVFMQESILYSRIPNGYVATFKIDEKEFKASIEYSPSLLESAILDFDTKNDRFFYESERAMTWKERQSIVRDIKPYRELGVYLTGQNMETFIERDKVKTQFNKIITNILEYDEVDVLSLVLQEGTVSFSTIIEEIARDFEEVGFKTTTLVDSTTLVPRSSIFRDDGLYDAMFGSLHLKEEGNDSTLIMAYGSFSPPTANHIDFLKAMIASGEKSGDEVMLFLQPNEEFESSGDTIRQNQAILRSIPGLESLNICLQEGIRDIYDAFTYAYSELKIENLILFCGSDQELAYSNMIKETNGKRTPNGYYAFKHIKVVSTGKPNPDKSPQAVSARNALLKGDFRDFLRSAHLPYTQSFKALFDLIRDGAESAFGVS